jgi:TonB family protein
VDTRPDRTSSDVTNTERSAAKAVQIETPGIQPLDLAVDGPALSIRATPAPVRRTEISDQPDNDQMRSAHLLRRSGAASIAMSLGTATVTVDEGILDGNGGRSIGGKGSGGGSGEGPGAGSGAGSGTGTGRGTGGGSGGGAGSLPSAGPGNPLPIYPPDALAAGAEGRVVLRASLRADGTVESLTVEKSAGWKSLDDSALETVRTWRFIPARRNDRPVSSVVMVPMRFRMLGGLSPP